MINRGYKMAFCRKCGKELPENAKFCGACGAEVSASEEIIDKTQANGGQNVNTGDPFGGYGAQSGEQNAAGGQYQQPSGGTYGAPYGNYNGNQYGQGAPYGGYNAPYPNQPYYAPNYAPARESVPLAPDGRKYKNKLGIMGFVFSLVSFFFFILIPIIAVAYVANHPELMNMTYIEYTEDLLALGSAILVLMLFTFLFAVAAIVLSGIGIAQRAKYRLNGFAIAGLVIACLSIFLIFMLFAAGA